MKIYECPFCSGDAKPRRICGWELVEHCVQCTNCGASTGAYETEEQAIEAWNERPSMRDFYEDVKMHGNDICEICKWSKIDIEECTAECETCETLCKCYYCNKFDAWEWRGVQNESN